MKFKSLLLCILLSKLSISHAIETLHVVGLFPGKVVVSIDNQQVVIRQGQVKQGVKFIKLKGDDVVLEINGKQSVYKMGTAVSMNFQKFETKKKTIYADRRGMFKTIGSINSHPIRFLIDTGATTVAMSSVQAKKLNIQYRLNGKETTARTASGIAKAYLVKLNKVKVGEISQSNVTGLVIVGAYPKQALLGMSFLNRLKVEKTGDAMTLESR